MFEMIFRPEIAACIDGRWRPVIGDPTIVGWATVAAYALAAVLALALTVSPKGRSERWFWCVLFILLGFLAINKQLDLQTLLTVTARCMAQIDGWYAQRRSIQVYFIIGVIVIAFAFALVLFIALRRNLGRVWMAALGFTLLLAFVAIRAAGFHHMDLLISTSILGVKLNWVMELTGIVLITLNAITLLIRSPTSRREHPLAVQ